MLIANYVLPYKPATICESPFRNTTGNYCYATFVASNFFEATVRCSNLRGWLATVPSEEENNIIKEEIMYVYSFQKWVS